MKVPHSKRHVEDEIYINPITMSATWDIAHRPKAHCSSTHAFRSMDSPTSQVIVSVEGPKQSTPHVPSHVRARELFPVPQVVLHASKPDHDDHSYGVPACQARALMGKDGSRKKGDHAMEIILLQSSSTRARQSENHSHNHRMLPLKTRTYGVLTVILALLARVELLSRRG